ncbi:MAG TPA: transglutaminase family protein [Acidimicrobiales bacterium]|nr:transglutaminase family protein [Acidimicrobiales bacterium]
MALTRLVMKQTFRYDYASPVGRLHHRLMVVPPASHGDQQRISSEIEVRGAKVRVAESLDVFGNVVVDIRAARVQAWVEFVVGVVVERSVGPGAVAGPDDCAQMLSPSALTEPDAALGEVARGLLASRDTGLALADRVNAWVAATMRYRHDVTSVRTTAAEALGVGAGVCQDYAHVMLALCRLCALPARYVSGHLVGEGGSHAWVEVLLPADGSSPFAAVAFDPTNNRRAGSRYLTVAVGSDYADVAPTYGTFSGPVGGVLSTHKTLAEETIDLVLC